MVPNGVNRLKKRRIGRRYNFKHFKPIVHEVTSMGNVQQILAGCRIYKLTKRLNRQNAITKSCLNDQFFCNRVYAPRQGKLHKSERWYLG